MLDGEAPLFGRKLAEAGITDADDITTSADIARIPLTRKQELRDSEAEHPPFGDYRFTDHRDCVRLGTSTGTTGTPTVALWTRKDIWIEYESAARNWWRTGWRPGQIVTHAHPAYLYGGGPFLSGSLEYFGAAQRVGGAARHRRAGRAGHPHVAAGAVPTSPSSPST